MGERIKRLRLEKNLTQEELASKFGLKRAAINKYEKGNVENMKRSVIEDMSKFFGVSPSYLMALDDSTSSIEEVFNKLDPLRQEKVFNYAKAQLNEQSSNKLAKLPQKEQVNEEEIIDLAAHSEIEDRIYTDEEIKEIRNHLDQFLND
ncbi:helix-turn-helix domain-containing protein [Enterococcus faecalis]|uniref:helix-turn-helix domain-containing protein n=1 Tax=Enterococcus faecalis TaxID=1351 RepID=UPI001F052F0E|nr:helix-turn-helix transcriptional regulator [Enterococcus faecalis]